MGLTSGQSGCWLLLFNPIMIPHWAHKGVITINLSALILLKIFWRYFTLRKKTDARRQLIKQPVLILSVLPIFVLKMPYSQIGLCSINKIVPSGHILYSYNQPTQNIIIITFIGPISPIEKFRTNIFWPFYVKFF